MDMCINGCFRNLWLAYNNRGWELCLGKPGDRLVFAKNRNYIAPAVKRMLMKGAVFTAPFCYY